jgi:hypothetical protein
VFTDETAAENAYLYALPATASGSVAVSAHTRLQGAELNLAAPVYQDACVTFALLAGFRFVALDEDLNLAGSITPLVPGFLTFLGAAADPPSAYGDFDSFKLYNRFYGGQVGARLAWRAAGFDLGLVGKLALGATQELAFVTGASTLTTPGNPPVTNPGGLLTQPSNIGRFYQSEFGVIPELDLNVGYWVTPQVKVTVGYSVLYWNKVARPGDQIDRTVSAAQVALDPNFGNVQAPLRPLFQFRDSAFWAQGVNFGVEFQY